MAENSDAAAKKKARLDTDQVDMASKIAISIAHAVDAFWETANKDDRISDPVKQLANRSREASKLRTPEARLRAQLDEVDRYAAAAQTGEGPRLVREGQAAGWQARAHQIRAKIPLVETMKGRTRAKHLRSLSKRTKTLLDEIIAADIENGVD